MSDKIYEYGVMWCGKIEQTGMSRKAALNWIKDFAKENGFRKDAFQLIQREVSYWTPAK